MNKIIKFLKSIFVDKDKDQKDQSKPG